MDNVFRMFLENTYAEATEFAAKSDVLNIITLEEPPPSTYACDFHVQYLKRLPGGTVEIHPGPVRCVIHFPSDYLFSTDPKFYMRVASVITPDFVHPNVVRGIVCLGGGFAAGTPISELIWLLFQIVSYRNCTLEERNAMNAEACRLIRSCPEMLAKLDRPRLLRPRVARRASVEAT